MHVYSTALSRSPCVSALCRAPQVAHHIPFTKRVIDDVDVYWATPATGKPMRGALLLFHGCSHSGTVWFMNPEEVIVLRAALAKGLAVMSFSSFEQLMGCWDSSLPIDQNMDVTRIAAALPSALKLLTPKVVWPESRAHDAEEGGGT